MMSCAGLQQSEIKYTRSSWTPLNDEENRSRVIGQRKIITMHLQFQLWPDDEKVNLLLKMIALCSLKEKREILDEIHRQIPQKHVDFTRYLPRVLSLYILSFLDPRSLCRIAQVCWNWKYLAESNEIWMKKCLKLGWNLPNAFAAIEHGAYKKLYINNMHYLRIVGPVQVRKTFSNELTVKKLALF
ncbi:unnamed protein product [Schistocephalus solidus]|uniref:F-box domain-containing protein n=1 Tax=Schistocephalus solidus TaxID=70667 RepID=A0A183SWR9_SCHSO|nr:unnamed protein product [Schistocephalus solidus]